MSWQTEDGRHEGYGAHVARDGRIAHGARFAGMLLGPPEDDTLTPWAELLGWEARCGCGWVGPSYRRTGDQQDPEELPLADAGPGILTADDAIHAAWLVHLAAQGAQ